MVKLRRIGQRILHAGDAGNLGQFHIRVERDGRFYDAGILIDDDGQGRGVRQGLEMPDDVGLAGRDIVGSERHDDVCAQFLRQARPATAPAVEGWLTPA